ncbi:MAG TPA: fatty acid desaturase, partial [Terriglobia bacterium]|nr:fatty acid desaturase [Terriglobia bacterium]
MNPTLEEEIQVPVRLSDVLSTSEIKQYRHPVPWRQFVDFSLVWIQILVGIAVFAWSPGIPTYILAVLLISGGQHGLGLVAHEFIHYNVVPGNRKLNDFLGTWLFAAPGGIPFAIFRYRHFLHHRHYSTDQDTKTIYRLDIRGSRIWWETLKRLFLLEYFHHVIAVVRSVRSDPKTQNSGPPLVAALPALIVTHAIIFAALWAIHPLAYFFLWLAPLLTLQMLFFNFRAITEHQPLRSQARSSDSRYFLGTAGPFVRTAGANLLERLFLCKINFGY